MEKVKNIRLKFGVFFLIGIIFSGMVSAMYLTKSVNFSCFYDVGDIYDVLSQDYKSEGVGWHYNYDTETISTDAENASHFFQLMSTKKNWQYLYLEIENLSQTGQWKVEFVDPYGALLYTVEQEIHNGVNIFELQEGQIQGFRAVVSKPCSFEILRIQFRERLQEFDGGDMAKVFTIVFSGFLLIFALAAFISARFRMSGGRNKEKGIWLETIQEFYSRFLDRAEELNCNISQIRKSQIRKVLFFISILIVYLMLVAKWRGAIVTQRRMVFLLSFCMIFSALISWEKAEKAVSWKNPLAYSWFAICFMCIISEFFVEKSIQNVGFFMLCAMGPLYLAWNSMKWPKRLLKDFLTALRWSYWAALFFCLFFRPFYFGQRYMGIYNNPNIFGRYLVTANIVFLIWLDENLNKERLKYWTLWRNVLGLASLWGFLRLTDSITSMFVYIIEWAVFIWKQFPNEKEKIYRRNFTRVIIASVFCLFLVCIPGKWCLSNIPILLNTEVALPGEKEETVLAEGALALKAEAAEAVEPAELPEVSSRLLDKVLSGNWYTLFAGRDEIWKIYIRNLNLFGHSRYLICYGRRMHAHNSLLQMMYDYGVFIAVPYLVMLYYSLKNGLIVIFRNREIGVNLFFLLATVSYIVPGLAENVATPYSYINWLVYFIAVGGLFSQDAMKRKKVGE